MYMIEQGEMINECPDHRAIMMNNGYHGAQDDARIIIPRKKSRRWQLMSSDEQRNLWVVSDRIIAENFYGGSSDVFGILSS